MAHNGAGHTMPLQHYLIIEEVAKQAEKYRK